MSESINTTVMMKNLQLINKSIEYIEENLTTHIDYVALARITNLSAYEFRRIFSFIVGSAPAEYIRKRRLSKSAMEIKAGAKVDIDFVEKYGYNSTQSFHRAFKNYYGMSVSEILSEDCHIKSFLPPVFSFILEKDIALEYTIVDYSNTNISAISGLSTIEDTVCCESVWKKFNKLNQNKLKKLSIDNKSYAVYQNGEKAVLCHIGIRTNKENELQKHTIVGGKFISFYCPIDASEDFINHSYKKIHYNLLPSSPFVYDKNRNTIEIFPLGDGDKFEILIPINVK